MNGFEVENKRISQERMIIFLQYVLLWMIILQKIREILENEEVVVTNSNSMGDEGNTVNKKNKTAIKDLRLKLVFKKKSQTLYVNTYIGKVKVTSRAIRLTNNVRTPEERGDPVKFHDYYYYPGEFPDGEWNVTDVGFSDDPDIGPYIKTDAGRYVDTYQLNEDSKFEKTGEQVYDTGYLFHGSDEKHNTKGNNNENYSTRGCGRGKNFDIMSVARQITEVKNKGGTVTVTVGD